MKRLLLLTPDFPPKRGGVARYLDGLAATFRDSILVLAAPEPGAEAFDASCGYPVERGPLEFRRVWPKWLRSVSLLWKYSSRYDLLLTSHVIPFGVVAYLNRLITKKPYVVILHGLDYELAQRSPRKRRLAHRVLNRAQALVTNSEWLKRKIASYVPNAPIAVVYPAVADRIIANANSGEAHVEAAPFTFLTVARLIERKGHLRVLAAIAALPEAMRNNLRYRIVGDGPMAESITAEISRLGLAGIVTISSDVTDAELPNAYRAADCFIMPVVDLPEDREGFGTVYLEAAAFGLPSIASNLPGIDEAVLDGRTGLLVREGDPGALTAAMRRLMEDEPLRQRLGENARLRAVREFSREAQFKKLQSIFS